MADEIRIKGLGAALKAIDATPAKVLEALRPIIEKHTAAIEGKARAGTTGSVADGIHSEVAEKPPRWIFGRIWSKSQQAIHVEYGTVNSGAKPYLRPAFQQEKAAFKSEATAAIKALES
jgi:hypothetical protein